MIVKDVPSQAPLSGAGEVFQASKPGGEKLIGKFGSYKGAFTYFKVIFLILPALLLISLMTLWGKGRGSAETEKVVYVNPAGLQGEGGAFRDLQQALDSSPPGSVFFCAGDLGDGEIEITQPARILGGFSGGEGEERDWVRNRTPLGSVTVRSDNVTLDGFIFAEEGGKIFFAEGENVGLKNCRFDGFSSTTGMIYFADCAEAFLENCYITRSRLETPAVDFSDSSARILHCTIGGNFLQTGQPVLRFRNSEAEIGNSILARDWGLTPPARRLVRRSFT